MGSARCGGQRSALTTSMERRSGQRGLRKGGGGALGPPGVRALSVVTEELLGGSLVAAESPGGPHIGSDLFPWIVGGYPEWGRASIVKGRCLAVIQVDVVGRRGRFIVDVEPSRARVGDGGSLSICALSARSGPRAPTS